MAAEGTADKPAAEMVPAASGASAGPLVFSTAHVVAETSTVPSPTVNAPGTSPGTEQQRREQGHGLARGCWSRYTVGIGGQTCSSDATIGRRDISRHHHDSTGGSGGVGRPVGTRNDIGGHCGGRACPTAEHGLDGNIGCGIYTGRRGGTCGNTSGNTSGRNVTGGSRAKGRYTGSRRSIVVGEGHGDDTSGW